MRTDRMPDLLPPPRRRPMPFGLAALSVAAAALLGLAVREAARTEASAPARLAAAPETQAFVPATRAAPARPAAPVLAGRLRLDDPDGPEPARVEPARLNPATGIVEETLVRGRFAEADMPALRLTLARDTGPGLPAGLFVTLARRAADGPALAVERTGARGVVTTKFGPVETLEATFAGPVRRVCTGFSTLEAAPMRIDGWLCAPLGLPPEPRAVACALDALVLDEADGPARDLFRSAEVRRDPACRAAPTAEAPGARTGSIRSRRSAAART